MTSLTKLFTMKLTQAQADALERLAVKLGMSKVDVIRLGLQFIAEANGETWPDNMPGVGVRHDYLERDTPKD